MGRHILESALPEHLHRGRSSRHPSLASCFICNGITVVRKKCSEASPLEVWVDHCSLSICPDIRDRFTWREKVSYDNRYEAHIRARPQSSETQWIPEALPCLYPRFLEACHVSWQLPALPPSRDEQSKEIGGRSIPQASYYTISFPFSYDKVVRSIIPSWFFSDRVECDIGQLPSMGKDVHGPRMNILLLAIFEYNLPDRIYAECVFAQLPYLIRIPKISLAELESGGKWFRHSYI